MIWLLSASKLLAWLLVMHALTDYVLQDERMGRYKNPLKNQDDSQYGPWWWTMSAHAGLNAGGVALITGSMMLGLLEFLTHFALDTMKCQGAITTHDDQFGHILSKVVWALWASAGV